MKDEMPRRLSTIKHNGKEYFIDWRLQEFRPVEPPIESIPFGSDLGREIDEIPEPKIKVNPIKNNITATCSKCGKVLFEGPGRDVRHLVIYCEHCF